MVNRIYFPTKLKKNEKVENQEFFKCFLSNISAIFWPFGEWNSNYESGNFSPRICIKNGR